MTLIDLICNLLCFEEGYKPRPYYCSEGYPTVAIGWRIGPKGAPLENYDMYVTKEVAKVLLLDRVRHIVSVLEQERWFSKLNDSRKAVLVSMAYQMGVRTLKKFTGMIAALKNDDYRNAQLEAIDSRWYKQTPNRATRHANTLEIGDIELVYGDQLRGEFV